MATTPLRRCARPAAEGRAALSARCATGAPPRANELAAAPRGAGAERAPPRALRDAAAAGAAAREDIEARSADMALEERAGDAPSLCWAKTYPSARFAMIICEGTCPKILLELVLSAVEVAKRAAPLSTLCWEWRLYNTCLYNIEGNPTAAALGLPTRQPPGVRIGGAISHVSHQLMSGPPGRPMPGRLCWLGRS